MKKTLINYTYIFIILLVCSFTFHISFQDYNNIKYFFPSRAIYIAISILVNYFYLKISFDCIEQYIEIDTFSLIRIGKEEFNKLLIKRVIKTIILFIILSVCSDLILYKDVCIVGLIVTLFIEIFLGVFMIVIYKKLNTHTFIVTLLICILVKGIISIFLNNNIYKFFVSLLF